MPDLPFTPPGADCPLAQFDGNSAALHALDPPIVKAAFADHGAVLLRNFTFEVDDFAAFAERICSAAVFNESPNRTLIDPGSTIQSVDLGSDAFPLHPELSREPWRPDACLFACFDPPAAGGETTICDGIAIVEALPDAVREAMAHRKLLYLQAAGPDVLAYWLGPADPDDQGLASPPAHCPYFFRRAGGRVVRGFVRPLLHRPLFDSRLAFGNFLLFARDFLGLANFPCLDDGRPVPELWLDAVRTAAAAHTYDIRWRRGDVILLDNSRFMHGRRAITDPRQRQIASYFGYVDFAPPNGSEPLDSPWRSGAFRPPASRS